MVEKVLRMFNKLDLQEIPPLVYQLLLLSAKVCDSVSSTTHVSVCVSHLNAGLVLCLLGL